MNVMEYQSLTMDSVWRETCCRLSLGEAQMLPGRLEGVQARTALSTAIEHYRAMAMAFWLTRAETALAQIVGGAQL
jgi:hypothetical protein